MTLIWPQCAAGQPFIYNKDNIDKFNW